MAVGQGGVFCSHCEASKASLPCFVLFGLSWKLMAGDNLVPLDFALAAGVQAETHVMRV